MAHYWHRKPYTLSVYNFPSLPIVGVGVLYPQNQYVTVTPSNTNFTHFIAKGFRIVIQNCPIKENPLIDSKDEIINYRNETYHLISTMISKYITMKLRLMNTNL